MPERKELGAFQARKERGGVVVGREGGKAALRVVPPLHDLVEEVDLLAYPLPGIALRRLVALDEPQLAVAGLGRKGPGDAVGVGDRDALLPH